MCDPNGNKLTQYGAVVRTGLAAIPTIGGALATAWSEWDTSRRFSRVEEAVNQLASSLTELGKKFDPDSIGDEELQLLEEVLRRIQIEHRERKRQRFVQLLTGAWTTQRDRPFDEKLRHVRALEQFSDDHISILKFLEVAKVNRICPTYKAIAKELKVPSDQEDERLLPALNDLASVFGFIKRAKGMTLDTSQEKKGKLLMNTNLSPEGVARGCNHTITDAGHRFLKLLSESPEIG